MPLTGNTGGGASANYVRIVNELPTGVDNGGSVAGAWNALPLNTITHNEGGVASLAANVITLAAGIYRAFCTHGGFNIATNRIRLRDTSNTLNYLGTNTATPNGNDTKSIIAYTFSIAAPANFVLELYTGTTRINVGLGQAQALPIVPALTELYTVCEFIQIGTP
jgi:hypothetical protein